MTLQMRSTCDEYHLSLIVISLKTLYLTLTKSMNIVNHFRSYEFPHNIFTIDDYSMIFMWLLFYTQPYSFTLFFFFRLTPIEYIG